MGNNQLPNHPNELVVISGPSCVGKTPLIQALKNRNPELMNLYQPLILYNNRSKRPGEVDGGSYHFCTTKRILEISSLQDHELVKVRNDLHLIDYSWIKAALAEKKRIFFEGNVYVAQRLLEYAKQSNMPILSIFITPISKDEIIEIVKIDPQCVEKIVFDIMYAKQLGRLEKLKIRKNQQVMSDVLTRASNAYNELRYAHLFSRIIPNYAGEDSDLWNAFPLPLGPARNTLLAVEDLLSGKSSHLSETWPSTLIPKGAQG